MKTPSLYISTICAVTVVALPFLESFSFSNASARGVVFADFAASARFRFFRTRASLPAVLRFGRGGCGIKPVSPWIETISTEKPYQPIARSPPARGRGLKL